MDASEPQSDSVVKVSRDLREVERLSAELHAQAVDDSNAKLMPGGNAMVALAHHGSHEAWESMQETTERTGKYYTSAEDEDPEDSWDPFMLLSFWSEDVRRQLGEEWQDRPTLVTEASYLRHRLEWLWDNEPRFDDFAKDVRTARLRLENIVHAGSRAERMRVVCDQCDAAPRLIKVEAREQGNTLQDFVLRDGYKCTACKHWFDQDAYERAYAKQLRSEGAERFVPLPDAIATLRAQGRPKRTIYKWLQPSEDPEAVVEGYCEVETRKAWAWWPDLWRRHLAAPTRKADDAA